MRVIEVLAYLIMYTGGCSCIVKRQYENLGEYPEARILCYTTVSNIKFGLY